jgi:hypothetical protein
MGDVELSTKTAKDRMELVLAGLKEAEERLSLMRARAALKEALEIAAKMQAYFDNDRHGEVIGLNQQLLELNDEKGLKNPEVAATGEQLVAKCEELARRANIHLEFGQMELKIDAVSHFPEGKSYAIVNGEVIGEGDKVAPELAVASVSGTDVFFDYKGERIALELTQ